MANDCPFCKIAAGALAADKLYEDEEVLAFRDIHPAAPVHVLIIPRKHLKGPEAVSEEDERVVGKLMRVAKIVADKEGIRDYRLLANNGENAGQTVFHLHVHLLGGKNLGGFGFK